MNERVTKRQRKENAKSECVHVAEDRVDGKDNKVLLRLSVEALQFFLPMVASMLIMTTRSQHLLARLHAMCLY